MGSVIPLKKSANSAYLDLKSLLDGKLESVEKLINLKLQSQVDLIKKMSDYCDSCDLSKENKCPVTNLYWAYLERHRDKLEKVQRMTIPMRNVSRRSDIQKAEDTAIFDSVSKRLKNGLPVME